MSRNIVETVMGAVVLVIAVIFLAFAYSTSRVHAISGYEVTAKFDHISGVRNGGDVRISGIKVGSIVSETLDPKTFQAVVRMSIEKSVKLPTDTVATITSASLLGEQFLELVPGADETTIPPGGEIRFTRSPVSLESLLGRAVFSLSSGGQAGGQLGGGAAPAPSHATPGPTPSVPPSGAGKGDGSQ